MKNTLLLLIFLLASSAFAQQPAFETRFELSDGKETATYDEGIAFYKALAEAYPEITIREMGPTDAGKPLHLVIFSANRQFDFEQLKADGKAVMLINNAIHPGEPDGVEASMMFLRDLAAGKVMAEAKEDVVLAIIPFYNIGGALNRSGTSRANQNGPLEYGFRGNARNYDLNRDFIKGDTRNARSFWEIFHEVDPDFFLDTHVSNGADYQYAITLIASQRNKMTKPLQRAIENVVQPALYNHMEDAGEVMTPYVNVYGTTPDNGFTEFADWPRYSTGYTALFHTFGFMSETHMLKPFDRRVKATYHLIEGMYKTLWKKKVIILSTRALARDYVKNIQVDFPIKWQLDKDYTSTLSFKGYEGSYIKSELTGQKRLYYDQSKPFEKDIPYRNQYIPSIVVEKPEYYVVPQGWHQVLSFLQTNGVRMEAIQTDTTMEVAVYRIDKYKTSTSVYEGHYTHYNVETTKTREMLSFRKGDILIPMDQSVNRFIVETLEPEAEDSYFKWNMFDMILSRKEGFSAYVFEDLAKDILAKDPQLAQAFQEKKQTNQEFSYNHYAQLAWIYERSAYKEPEHLRYPIFRIE